MVSYTEILRGRNRIPVVRRYSAGSVRLNPAEVPLLFWSQQEALANQFNAAGRGVFRKRPTSAQLALVKTRRDVLALALTCTRPL
jgi:hypothetical protein